MPGMIPSVVATTKPTLKVSFRDRIKRSLHHQNTKISSPVSTQQNKHHRLNTEKEQLSPTMTSKRSSIGKLKCTTIKCNKLSAHMSKENIKHFPTLGPLSKNENSKSSTQLRPWSKLKLATIVSRGVGSCAILNKSMNDGSPPGPQLIQIAKIKPTTSVYAATGNNCKSALVESDRNNPGQRSKNRSTDSICASDSEMKNIEIGGMKSKRRPKSHRVLGQPKNYRSVDDLSPEFTGLSFVKKMKILNERQNVAELEITTQKTRSLSLDHPNVGDGINRLKTLIRSHSEGCGMVPPKPATNIIVSSGVSMASSNGTVVPIAPLSTLQPIRNLQPTSPEANETPERRQLKSILKNLSEAKKNSGRQQTYRQLPSFEELDDHNILLNVTTVEGYVARHIFFKKMVILLSFQLFLVRQQVHIV